MTVSIPYSEKEVADINALNALIKDHVLIIKAVHEAWRKWEDVLGRVTAEIEKCGSETEELEHLRREMQTISSLVLKAIT